MGKYVNDIVMEQGLHHIRASCDTIGVCYTEPSTYASAFSTAAVGEGHQCMASTGTLASADFTMAADASGVEVTLSKRAGLTIVNNGTADHIALGCFASQKLILVTTCTQQILTSGGTVDINAFKDNILDAA